MICPDFQELLKPIYYLTGKGRPFIWIETEWRAFDKIKKIYIKPPVLQAPDNKGRFQCFSDSSIASTTTAPYQYQGGKL